MASRATIQQITTLAMVEGFSTMMWEQRYQHREQNKTFARMHQNLTAAASAAIAQVVRDSGGMNAREYRRAFEDMERLKQEAFPKGRTINAMEVIAMSLDLLNSILNKLKPGTPRHTATLRVWHQVRAFERYFDRHKTYDDPIGLVNAHIYRRIINP